MSRFIIIIQVLLLTHLSFAQSNFEYRFGRDINRKDYRKYLKLQLIDKDEQILAYWGINTDESNSYGFFQLEDFTLLTSKRLINYEQVGSDIKREEAFFDDIITIRTSKEGTYLDVWLLDSVRYDPKYQENHLRFDVMFVHGVYQRNQNGSKFFDLVNEQWKGSKAYERNVAIYNDFFDEKGNYIMRHSDSLRYKAIYDLKNDLERLGKNIALEYGNLYNFKDDKIFEIDYDVFTGQFRILTLEIENSKAKAENMDMVLFYKGFIEGKLVFPCEFEGVIFLGKSELVSNDPKEIIRFIQE